MSPPTPSSAKLTLSYPLYGADFDPLNSSLLLVGGGGGEGRSGVGNKISLLNTSRRHELSEIVEIDLSKQEDSVTSLAVAQSSDTSITAYAGINSSQAEQLAGRNRHFRSFRLHHPPAAKATPGADDARDASSEKSGEKSGGTVGTTEALGQTSFFRPSPSKKPETYQRITCVSGGDSDAQHRIAAIATGLATESEIVVLRAVSAPEQSDEIARTALQNREAADLDIIPCTDEDSEHLLAFCTDTEVFVQKVCYNQPNSGELPTPVYSIPVPNATATTPPPRPKFRALRFLTPRHVLLVQNLPQRTGVELLILKLSESGALGRVTLQKRLSKTTKAAVAFDVCRLSKAPTGEYQIIVAVAGHGGSIELLTLEFSPSSGVSSFRSYTALKDVHPASITKMVFSKFVAPPMPVTKDVRPQYVKLASVSVGQTVVVHTLPLQPYPVTKSRTPRYVMASPGTSEPTQAIISVFMATVVIAIAAFLLQAFTEIRGGVPPYLGAADWLSPRMKHLIHRPYMFADGPILPAEVPVVRTTPPNIEQLVAAHAAAETPKAIIVRDDGRGAVSTEVHHHDADAVQMESVKKWEELNEQEKEGWKQKLSEAGHWTASMGESILQGIFFSELAGAVGNLVGG